MQYPKLNPVDAFPVEYKGEKFICLRDPQGNNENSVLVSELALYILSYFDGNHSVENIAQSFKNRFGKPLDRKEIEDLILELDKTFLLESESYLKRKHKIESDFFNSNIRHSFHAGISYPDNIDRLNQLIDSFYKKAKDIDLNVTNDKEVKGIISPHIDFNRGGKSYAVAYRELTNLNNVETFLILGTSHFAQTDSPFILSKKSFATPYGKAKTDIDFIEQLEEMCDWDLFEGEIAHRNEHSIEFQVVFLQHFLNGKNDFKIVPILCNSFHKHIQNGVSPNSDEKTLKSLSNLRKTVKKTNKRICIIAGVDMAHVGQKFGDPEAVNDRTLSWIEERDKLTLSFAEKIDPEGFYRSVEEEKDKRKICGLSSIYSLLSIIDAKEGKVLDYDKALEPDTGSVVTFASAVFYK